MSIPASDDSTDILKGNLRLHLARYDEQGDSMMIGTLQWKVLEIPEGLESELRRKIFDLNQKPSGWCALL